MLMIEKTLSLCPVKQNQDSVLEKMVSILTRLIESNLEFGVTFSFKDSDKEVISSLLEESGIEVLDKNLFSELFINKPNEQL
ncbi:MAG: hypothetical protein E7080_07140 [Bacteroidales bacterium]|nr:hypothetical protein [Bacteroidales bacterium]